MKRQTLVNGLLSITAVSLMTGCMDNKYDLTDIDTTSRLTVDNLIVPVNLSEIRLKNVINISEDDETIKKIEIDGKECYAIKKAGNIETSEFSIGSVHVASVPINPINFSIPINISSGSTSQNVDLDVDITEQPLQNYHFNIDNIDSALKKLINIKTLGKIKIDVTLSVPESVVATSGSITFKNLRIKLPWGLLTDANGYSPANGEMTISEVQVGKDGKARFQILANGLEFGEKGNIVGQSLDITDVVGIEGGLIHISMNFDSLPKNLEVKADFSISPFDIDSFSGLVEYHMNDVEIAPVALTGLPDFLNSPETEIRIANPYILVDMTNPVGKYNLEGTGKIKLTSKFGNGKETEAESDNFTIGYNGAKLAFGSTFENYEFVKVNNLGDILTNAEAGGLPQSIAVNVKDLVFSGEAIDFPAGTLGKSTGDYNFTAPLGFANQSKIIYETTEGDWGSDDIEDIYINTINLKANCTTDLPVGVELSVIPVDKYGNEISVTEDSSHFEVPAMSNNQEVRLSIKGANGPIHGFDGVKFKAVVTQNDGNTQALGPDQTIKLTDLRVTVNGYFEKEL